MGRSQNYGALGRIAMCVVSMVMDHYGDEWNRRFEEQRRRDQEAWERYRQQGQPYLPILPQVPAIRPEEIEEFRRLLERAREYDKRNNEPDCELESKRERVRKLAEELGVKVDFV